MLETLIVQCIRASPCLVKWLDILGVCVCFNLSLIFKYFSTFAGAVLSVGGFLNFMLTGSVSAIRFGVILGGILLALSVSSLRSWRKGEISETTLKGQAG